MNARVQYLTNDGKEFDRVPGAVAAEQGFDFSSVWRVLRNRKWLILGTIGGILALTALALAVMTPIYNATALLMLDQRKNSVADVNTVLSGLPADQSTIQNQIQVLTSRQLATRVVEKLGLDRDAEFGLPARTGELRKGSAVSVSFEEAVERLLKRLKVEQVATSTTMTVSVGSQSAERSAVLTNALVETYIEDQLNTKFQATKKAIDWLGMRVRELASQVQVDDAAVQKYKADAGIVDTGVAGSLVDQQTANVSTQLTAARADLAQKIASYDRIAALGRAGRAGDASEVVAAQSIVALRSQQAELERVEAQYASRYLPEHPKMQDIRAQVRDTRGKIDAEIRRIIEGAANNVAVARANVTSLEKSLGRMQSQYRDQSSASVKLKALQSIAAASRSMYENVLARLKEVQGQEGIATPDARIVSRAVAPANPSLRAGYAFGVAIPASLALGLLFAFIAEGVDTTVRGREQVIRSLGLPLLATVPEASVPASASVSDLVAREPASPYAEAIRGLFLGLTRTDGNSSPPKVVLVTSSVAGEGKTAVALSLARVAARMGRRVVVVDADFRRPTIASSLKLGGGGGGIVKVLRGELPLEKCIVSEAVSGVSILPCTDIPADPTDILASNAMESLLSTLRGKYNFIVIDTAPVLPVHDTWQIARFADATLLVVRAGRTACAAAASAVSGLRSMGANVSGVALTRAEEDPRSPYYGYLAGRAANAEAKAAA